MLLPPSSTAFTSLCSHSPSLVGSCENAVPDQQISVWISYAGLHKITPHPTSNIEYFRNAKNSWTSNELIAFKDLAFTLGEKMLAKYYRREYV